MRDALNTFLAANKELREKVAVELYREDKVSLGKASEIAALSYEEMKELLARNNVTIRRGPESFLNMLKLKEEDLDKFIRRSLAVGLYREGRLSLGRSAEVAGVKTKWEMLMLLKERGVPLDYTAESVEKDLKNLQESLGRD